MGWTNIDLHQDKFMGKSALIENEIRDLLGEHVPKEWRLTGIQVYFEDEKAEQHLGRHPVIIDFDKKEVAVFK